VYHAYLTTVKVRVKVTVEEAKKAKRGIEL
jgi:hypothetical protein